MGATGETTSRRVEQAPSIPDVPLWADPRVRGSDGMVRWSRSDRWPGRRHGDTLVSGEELSDGCFFFSLPPGQIMVPPVEENWGSGAPAER